MVGRITAALDRAGVVDNTAVVFTTDHGEMAWRSRHAGEAVLLRGGVARTAADAGAVAFIRTAAGGRQRGAHRPRPDDTRSARRVSAPTTLKARAWFPVLSGEETLEGNDVFIEWNGISPMVRDRFLGSDAINRMLAMPYRSVVSDRWKLNLCAGDQGELFDLRSDPYEQNNLFDDPAQRDRSP